MTRAEGSVADRLAMTKALWGIALGTLLVPGTAFAQDTQPIAWALVGVSVDREAVVITPVGALRKDAVPHLLAGPEGEYRVELRAPASSTSDGPRITNGAAKPKPKYVLALPRALQGERISGAERTTTLFDSFSWNAWRGKRQTDVYVAKPTFAAPSTVGLNVADARSIVVDGLGVPEARVKVRGPEDGYVVKQVPARTGSIKPTRTRVTFTTKSIAE